MTILNWFLHHGWILDNPQTAWAIFREAHGEDWEAHTVLSERGHRRMVKHGQL